MSARGCFNCGGCASRFFVVVVAFFSVLVLLLFSSFLPALYGGCCQPTIDAWMRLRSSEKGGWMGARVSSLGSARSLSFVSIASYRVSFIVLLTWPSSSPSHSFSSLTILLFSFLFFVLRLAVVWWWCQCERRRVCCLLLHKIFIHIMYIHLVVLFANQKKRKYAIIIHHRIAHKNMLFHLSVCDLPPYLGQHPINRSFPLS